MHFLRKKCCLPENVSIFAQNKGNMDLSIIIISYNTEALLRNCLNSVYGAEWKSSYEIIVVDNNSKDGTLEMLRNEFPEVKVIANSVNNLFAKANNQGAAIASGRWLLLLNSDTIVEGDNLQRLLDYADTLPDDVVCVGPKILNTDRTLQSEGWFGLSHYAVVAQYYKLASILPTCIGKRILPPATYAWNRNIPHEVGWVSGAAMLINAEKYREAGGLNERIEFYGEEPEFCYRCHKKGLRTMYYPHSSVMHIWGGSTKPLTGNVVEIICRRYARVAEETVGYDYEILSLRLINLSRWIKYLISPQEYTKGIITINNAKIKYMKNLKKEKKNRERREREEERKGNKE
jgi:GT2 family glycosyltransferase